METFPKRFRSELDGPRSREVLQGEAAVEHQRRLVQEWGAPHLASGRGGDQECRRFNTPEGCPYGSFCRFRHVPSGSFPLLQAASSERRLQELGAPKLAGWRGGDHECRHFNTPEGCPYGLACHFWHVPKGLPAKLPASVHLHLSSPSTTEGSMKGWGGASESYCCSWICKRR